MAHKRINLLPTTRRQQFQVTIDTLLASVGLMVALFVGGSYISLTSSLRKITAETAQLQAADAPLVRQLAAAKDIPAADGGVGKDSLASLESVLTNKAAWTEPFRELSGLVPIGVWLSKLNASYDKAGARIITISGSAESEKKVSEFFSALEQSYYFRNVAINFSERQKEIAPLLYNFEFSIPLKSDTQVVSNASR